MQADAGSLSFGLHGEGGQGDREVAGGQRILFPAADGLPEATIASPPAAYARAGGIDIRV